MIVQGEISAHMSCLNYHTLHDDEIGIDKIFTDILS